MTETDLSAVPEDFVRVLNSLREARLRPEIHLDEVPAPGRIAPYSVALTGEVRPRRTREGAELASGRFVVLHDPAGQDAWEGTLRVVTLLRAAVEDELAIDPLLSHVAWTWLEDALAESGVAYDNLGGTVTRVMSDTFGVLVEREGEVELELRASWTPRDPELANHLEAWGTLLCTGAGLPPLPDGVTALAPRR